MTIMETRLVDLTVQQMFTVVWGVEVLLLLLGATAAVGFWLVEGFFTLFGWARYGVLPEWRAARARKRAAAEWARAQAEADKLPKPPTLIF